MSEEKSKTSKVRESSRVTGSSIENMSIEGINESPSVRQLEGQNPKLMTNFKLTY